MTSASALQALETPSPCVGWVKRSDDPTPIAGGNRDCVRSSLTLGPTYGWGSLRAASYSAWLIRSKDTRTCCWAAIDPGEREVVTWHGLWASMKSSREAFGRCLLPGLWPQAAFAAVGTERSMRERAAHPLLMFILLLSLSPKEVVAADKAMVQTYHKAYTFTVNTFTPKIPSFDKHLNDFKGKPGLNYLEIGTFEGRSALWVLENILTHPTSKLTIIDVFAENNYKTFIANVNLSGEATKFTILSGFSTHKLRELPFNSFDLAYVDGSGKGIVMLSDLVSTWNLLKVGGVIICSRYSLSERLRNALNLQPADPGPHEAIDTFVKFYKPYITVVAFEEHQVFIRKNRSAE